MAVAEKAVASVGDWFMGVLVLGGVLLMVRPSSQGPTLVTGTLTGLTSLVKTVTTF